MFGDNLDSEVQSRKLLMKEAAATAGTASLVSEILANHASSQRRRGRLLRGANFIVGIAVTAISLFAFVPDAKGVLTERRLLLAALIAGFFLIADAVLPSLRDEPNPDRFHDYSYFIQNYVLEMKSLESEHSLELDVWEARMRELIRLTRLNVDDVFRKWPWIREKARRQRTLAEYWQ